jgi:hypothetical protein
MPFWRIDSLHAPRCAITDTMAKNQSSPKTASRTASLSRLKTGETERTEPSFDALYRQVREIFAAARGRAWRADNTAMVNA